MENDREPTTMRTKPRLAVMALLSLSITAQAQGLEHFITRSGDKLMDGPQEFRFISFNIPNLHLIEDHLPFEGPSAWRWPNEFEIADALTAVQQMGGRAVRTYVISVRRADEDPSVPRHVERPGQFNEDAFRALDKVLQVANQTGVRVIIPLVDQWRWWGGIGQYAAFRGKQPDAFWTDPQLIADFKQTVNYVINRKNTYTGTLYKDDKAIMAWETGNELYNPYSWSKEISAYIKSLDPNHLVIDGYHAGERGLQAERLDDPNIDIMTTHHYPGFRLTVLEAVEQARRLIAGRKAYFVGEVGFIPTEEIGKLFDWVIKNGVSGALVWSLRYRTREGGFYWHSEPAGGGLYKAYHWPGFASGDAYDEAKLLRLMREKDFEIQGVPAPPLPPPAPPILLPIKSVHAISWQGTVGATSYDVERATSASGPWTLVGMDVDETTVQYRPLFADSFAEQGGLYYYRVRAKNYAGSSKPSNVVGPVKVDSLAIVDEFQDFSRVFAHDGLMAIDSGNTRQTKEDTHRLKGGDGNWIVYRTLHPLRTAKVQVFFPRDVGDFEFLVSKDGVDYAKVEATRRDHFTGKGDYDYMKPVSYELSGLLPGHRFLKIVFKTEAQISRVEVEHGQ
jgi:hypothetical protein